MKFLHLADLHLGKSVKEESMLPGQRHVLAQVVELVRAEAPEAVVIAGDIYDRMLPPAAAVELFDELLTGLAATGTAVLIISGNHDSPERLAFAGRLLRQSGIHLYSDFDGSVHTVTLGDEEGPVVFHLLPFLKPATARHFFPEAGITDTHSAFAAVLAAHKVDPAVRNVLVAHQFVTAGGRMPEESDSEIAPVGGLDNVDAALFDAFDYVALGHLHGPQQMGRATVRYAGSPLKYSFSEAGHNKSAVMVALGPKGRVDTELLPLAPLHDMRRIRGPMERLADPAVVAQGDAEDYLHVTLTDEGEVPDAMARLRSVYPHVLELAFDNSRTRAVFSGDDAAAVDEKDPMELLADFFEAQNGHPMTEGQREAARQLMEAAEVEG